MNRRINTSLVAASVLLVAACVLLASCVTPSVNVQTARLGDINLRGLNVDLFLNVDNPNQFALPLEEVDWKMQLFDLNVGSGTSRMDKNLPAQESTRIKMPIEITFRSASEAASKVVKSRSIPWTLDGTMTVRAPTGPIGLDFGDNGRWDNPLR
ncbi:MAG: LEA type 2 family protein [Persicimonas sp.]